MNLVRRSDVPNRRPEVAPNGGDRDERDVFHVTFDPKTESVGQVVVESVAAIQNKERADLEPMYETIDPDSLDDLIAGGERRTGVEEIRFQYEGMDVVVGSGGDVWLQWR